MEPRGGWWGGEGVETAGSDAGIDQTGSIQSRLSCFS